MVVVVRSSQHAQWHTARRMVVALASKGQAVVMALATRSRSRAWWHVAKRIVGGAMLMCETDCNKGL